MKQDTDKTRVMALIKRLVQVMLSMDVTFILGSLWIVGEVRLPCLFAPPHSTNSLPFFVQLLATIPGLRNMLNEPENLEAKKIAAVAAAAAATEEGASTSRVDTVAYDGKKREPQFSNAQNSCLWELVRLM